MNAVEALYLLCDNTGSMSSFTEIWLGWRGLGFPFPLVPFSVVPEYSVYVWPNILVCDLFRIMLKNCPRLHTLRLQHLCVPSMYPSSSFEVGPSPLRVADVGPEKYVLPPVLSCGCGQLSEKAFAAVRWHCPDLNSVTLVLQVQHIPDIACPCCNEL